MAATPNYQGMFLRGYGSQSHTKNNGSQVGNTITNHISGGIGAIQGDAIRNIYGNFGDIMTGRGFANGVSWSNPGTSGWATGQSAFATSKDSYFQYMGISSNTNPTEGRVLGMQIFVDLNASKITPIATEVRPANMAVRYLIRTR